MKKRIFPLIILVSFMLILAGAAQALLCRADPLVILDDGTSIDFGASISTLPLNVEVVEYELHIPEGVTVVASVHTPTWLTSQESFVIYADQLPGQYQTMVTVHTTLGNADVVADATLISPEGLALSLDQKAGKEGEQLTLTLSD